MNRKSEIPILLFHANYKGGNQSSDYKFSSNNEKLFKKRKKDEDFLFTGKSKNHLSKQAYVYLIKRWCKYLELDPMDYRILAVIRSQQALDIYDEFLD